MTLLRSLGKYKWAICIAAVAVFLFYWFEIRPIQVYRGCVMQSSADARNLLKQKAEIAKNTPDGAAYSSLLAKNMYLHTDYQSFLQKCLLYYGVTLPPDMKEQPQGAATMSSAAASQPKKK